MQSTPASRTLTSIIPNAWMASAYQGTGGRWNKPPFRGGDMPEILASFLILSISVHFRLHGGPQMKILRREDAPGQICTHHTEIVLSGKHSRVGFVLDSL